MKEGDVVIVAMPQADGASKNRPVVFLRELPPFRDALVCGVSTQLRHKVTGFDEIITTDDPDFESSGLIEPSLVRLGFLTTVARSKIAGSVGSISRERHHRLLKKLSEYMVEDAAVN